MLDIKEIRRDRDAVEKALQKKEPGIDLSLVVDLDEKIRNLKTEAENLQSRRKKMSKEIGLRKRNGEDSSDLLQEMGSLSDKVQDLNENLRGLEESFVEELAKYPNVPQEHIKVSPDAADNELIHDWGEKPTFSFPFKNHLELNEKLKLFDFVRGAKIGGAGWPTYRGLGARLEWALLNYMIDTHVRNGFEQWMVPHMVQPDIMFGSGQLPKFKGQFYELSEGQGKDLYLIPTSEVPLLGLHLDEILEEEELPLRYTAYTPCFRKEAGAAGSNERGLIRVHQFNKVEMFCFTTPEQSEEIFEQMQASAESILKGLNLHYRSMLLVTGDMSFGAAKTVDVECWLPGQNRYYEVSSVSNCGDYQARRAKIRYRKKGEKPELVHTLNGSGLATSRLMVALLENNQNEDGSVDLPEVLWPYMGGIKKLEPLQ